jgi:hypothetical protein
MNTIEREKESTLSNEIEEFKKEKERIRAIVGKIGATPTFGKKILNILFIFLVIVCFSLPFIFPELHLPMIEFGLMLISIKIIYLLHSNSRQMHFMFWILTSLEWRLNEITKKLDERR